MLWIYSSFSDCMFVWCFFSSACSTTLSCTQLHHQNDYGNHSIIWKVFVCLISISLNPWTEWVKNVPGMCSGRFSAVKQICIRRVGGRWQFSLEICMPSYRSWWVWGVGITSQTKIWGNYPVGKDGSFACYLTTVISLLEEIILRRSKVRRLWSWSTLRGISLKVLMNCVPFAQR